jgi:hypothetical protein
MPFDNWTVSNGSVENAWSSASFKFKRMMVDMLVTALMNNVSAAESINMALIVVEVLALALKDLLTIMVLVTTSVRIP